MKPANVTSVLLVGPQDAHKSSFLMQGAVHFAERGHTVVYITANEFDSLPPSLEGLTRPAPDVFSLIKFLYLPGWQDLLQHVFHMHLHALVPTVLILEALEHFCNLADVADAAIGASEVSQAALICASLLDGASVCARRSKSHCHLVVSFNQHVSQSKFSPLIDIFFTDVVWTFCKDRADNREDSSEEYYLTNLETPCSQAKQYKIFFKPQPSEGAIILSKVSFWEKIQEVPS